LLTGSGDELRGPLPSLFQAANYHPPAVSTSAFPAFVYWKFVRLSPCLLPFSSALSATLPLFYVLVFTSLFFVQLFFCLGEVSLPRGLYWFILGVSGGILHDTWCSPVGLPNVSQAGLESAHGGTAAFLFSQCNVAWRSFPQARDSGHQSFDYPCCFISANCGYSISQRFLSHGAHSASPPSLQSWISII
jgi:hypothetical protein